MKYTFLLAFITIFSSDFVYSQFYEDHFGTGNDFGVVISSSPDESGYEGENSLNGTGYFVDESGAARFLGQAALGANYETIQYVSQIGIDAWIDEQMALPSSSYLDTYDEIRDQAMDIIGTQYATPDTFRRRDYLQFTFYEKVLKEPDLLRHKVAFALSQILVNSHNMTNLVNRSHGLASYYDILYKGAFGNYRDILFDVTLHPAMGVYLSTFQNKREDPFTGVLPDENYAREVMQLFTIGLYELNNDGTRKLDANGDVIHTYDIEDIQELAKVFTGFSGGAYDLDFYPQYTGQVPAFNGSFALFDLTVPMKVHIQHHEQGSKVMIDGSVIPPGQGGVQDINDALDVLFAHDNVGPFISSRLIQHLVKSNPTPQYVNRVASVFNDNGSGVKGDLEAVVKCILTDPEARSCEWINDAASGRLVQPVERFTNLFRGFDISSPSGKLWYLDFNYTFGKVEQSFMASPTVFNFFTPFYAEEEYVGANNMVSPEFQILHSTSGINYINLIENAIKIRPFINRTGTHPTLPYLGNDLTDTPSLDFTDEIAVYNNDGLSALIDRLDLIIAKGQLDPGVKNTIIASIGLMLIDDPDLTAEDVVKEALYFIMMSPNYMILK